MSSEEHMRPCPVRRTRRRMSERTWLTDMEASGGVEKPP